MKSILTTAIIGLFVMITSCDPTKQFEAELTQIDSLQVISEDMEAKYDAVNFDSLQIMVDHVVKNEEQIKLYYKPDTLNEDLGRHMNECKGIRKTLTNLKEKKLNYGDEINALKHQFINLEEDIKKGLLTKEEIKGYIENESEALRNFERSFMEFYELQKIESLVYYVTVPKVDAFIEDLKAKANNTIE